jgi:hypothetical protein
MNRLPTTKNIVHLAYSAKYEDVSSIINIVVN